MLRTGGVAALVLLLVGGLLYTRGRGVLRHAVAEPVADAPSATTSSSTRRRCSPPSATTSRSGCCCSEPDRSGRSPPVVGPLARSSSTLAMAVAQLAEPLVGVLADQPDRPGQRVRAGAGHPGVDQGVQHDPLRLAQPGHHRHRGHREQLDGVAQPGAPGDLAPVAVLGLAGDLDPLLPGGLAEPGDPPGRRRGRSARPASVSANSPSSAGSSPTIRISSRSMVTSGAPANHSSGSRPCSHAAASSAPGRSACCHPPRPGPRPPRPARASRGASVRTSRYLPVLCRLRDYTATVEVCSLSPTANRHDRYERALRLGVSCVSAHSRGSPDECCGQLGGRGDRAVADEAPAHVGGRPPSTSGRSASSGTPGASGSPATTTVPPGASRRAACEQRRPVVVGRRPRPPAAARAAAPRPRSASARRTGGTARPECPPRAAPPRRRPGSGPARRPAPTP